MSADRPGETALIARYFAPLAGPGTDALRDDAASLTPRPGHDLVVTVDAIVAGIHYFPDDPPASIARKALGVNLSDLAAKGAEPRGCLLTLALADDWTEPWLAAFSEGMGEATQRYGCPLLGGDTVRTAGSTLISVTAIGEVGSGAMIPRRGARPGDRLLVSGTIGDAALGLAAHLDPNAAGFDGLAAADRAYLRDRYLHPQPRLALASVLRCHARAAMDVSDGLVGDLAKMTGEGVTARVTIDAVPLSTVAKRVRDRSPELLATMLTGGDDYELLCAVPAAALPTCLADARATGVPLTEIGVFEPGEGAPLFVSADGSPRIFDRGSFSHF